MISLRLLSGLLHGKILTLEGLPVRISNRRDVPGAVPGWLFLSDASLDTGPVADILQEGKQLLIRPLPPAAVLLNGMTLTQDTPLRVGHLIQIGQTVLEVYQPTPEKSALKERPLWIELESQCLGLWPGEAVFLAWEDGEICPRWVLSGDAQGVSLYRPGSAEDVLTRLIQNEPVELVRYCDGATWMGLLRFGEVRLGRGDEILLHGHKARIVAERPETELVHGESMIGAYDLGPLLGQGASGDIFLAHRRDGGQSRPVAIKILREKKSERLWAMLTRELEALRSLRHPNIVELYDWGSWEDSFYLVMELMTGWTLDARLRRGPLNSTEFQSLVRDACRAVNCLHNHGVVHCDIKPSNLFCLHSGAYKLFDFGIATVPGDAARQTRGTPAYMAPELFAGGSSTPYSDQYALGLVFYEALAGQKPFAGNSPEALSYHHQFTEAPLLTVCEARIASVVARMLAKDPRQRFPEVTEAQDALLG